MGECNDMFLNLIIVFLISVFVFSSCINFPQYSNPGEKIVHEIQIKSNRKLARSGIYSCMTGGYSVESVVIDGRYVTNCYRFTSIAEARAFFCAFFDWYVQPFKDEPRIRPYLHKFPLTEMNFELSLVFIDCRNERLHKPYISRIRNSRGRIIYSAYDPSAGPAVDKSCPVLLVETFEEARERLKNGEKQLPEITRDVMEKLFHLSIQGNDM
jgi:hypothetical protein